MLFLSAAAQAVGSAFFGQGTGGIFLDEVMCTGSENGLLSCPNSMVHDCTHSEDAGVRCQGARKNAVSIQMCKSSLTANQIVRSYSLV
jgi:deleted-in-malignant-brain-tumors protein 1